MQLTQKETLYLKDAASHEKLCITKYTNYANQLQDTELATMFKDLAQNEQQHLNTINDLLKQAGQQTQ